MPTVSLHSQYWQTQAGAGGASSRLASYPLWQTSIITQAGFAATFMFAVALPRLMVLTRAWLP